MSNLYPEVRDISTLTGIFNLNQFLVIGIEGQMLTAGDATVGTPYLVDSPGAADARFGSASPLASLCKFILGRGINFVYAVASKKDTTPSLTERRTAWQPLEELRDVRIRLTDSMVQADLVALADSAEWADSIQNKQFAIGGLATPSTSGALTTAVAAIASKRAVLIGPGIYNSSGALLAGNYAAALAACEITQNPDITDDMDTKVIIGMTGIEKDANGMPLFRKKAGAGTPTNDHADLLAAGVSTYQQSNRGGIEFTHLRTTWTTDSTYDALVTLLIKDQLFIDIRIVIEEAKYLRRPNTDSQRSALAAIVERELEKRAAWVGPKAQPDGSISYGVTVTPSTDKKKMTVTYHGEIIRNTQVIEINAIHEIAA